MVAMYARYKRYFLLNSILFHTYIINKIGYNSVFYIIGAKVPRMYVMKEFIIARLAAFSELLVNPLAKSEIELRIKALEEPV